MDTTQIKWDYLLVFLLGFGLLTAVTVFDLSGFRFLPIGIMLALIGVIGQVMALRNSSEWMRSAFRMLGMLGLGASILYLKGPVSELTPSFAVIAVTLLVLGALMLTEYLTRPVAWGGMTVGSALAAVAELLRTGPGSLFGVVIFGGFAVVFAGFLIRSLRTAPRESSDA